MEKYSRNPAPQAVFRYAEAAYIRLIGLANAAARRLMKKELSQKTSRPNSALCWLGLVSATIGGAIALVSFVILCQPVSEQNL
jgi:hypothetical protein